MHVTCPQSLYIVEYIIFNINHFSYFKYLQHKVYRRAKVYYSAHDAPTFHSCWTSKISHVHHVMSPCVGTLVSKQGVEAAFRLGMERKCDVPDSYSRPLAQVE